jgi:hypothetical protein
MPQQIQDDTLSLNCQTYTINSKLCGLSSRANYTDRCLSAKLVPHGKHDGSLRSYSRFSRPETYSIQWNSYSMLLNLAFISILNQRNIKWGFSCNGVCKESLSILPDCSVYETLTCVNLLHPQRTSRYTETYFVLP